MAKKNEATGTIKVRLVKGLRGTKGIHRLSVKALGLGKLNSVRELKDSPQVRGLINKVHYLVRVEE
ncbi:50S ribosomal protein L30 [Cognatiluteimonas lumbrici]|uniref:50S ribosomal protein L30 n=1 Tax=Cognatiluteimonas lumbrici TaxID=2559601 RepID=UPI00112743BC|nr:50S ribosomal protein L30 [Luteimonas lumbrici]